MIPTVLLVVGLIGSVFGQRAVADQSPMEPQSAVQAREELAEITVVAQKQNIDLQKAAVAITALSSDDLARSNVVTPLDLNGHAPGLVITTSEGYNRSVSIRGIGFSVPQTDSAQPSVSYHEDGIYIANPVALNSGFLDVDHVEVLRGPQGTVFGQNSIGGTINVISKQPTFGGVNGYADIGLGSFDLVHTSAALNLPLSQIFAVRMAYDQNYQHGDVLATEVPGDYRLNDVNNVHARIQGLLQPTDDLSILLRVEYAQAHQHEAQGKSIDDPNPDPWSESSDWPGRLFYNQQLAAGTITYRLPFATLKVISSYQEVNQRGSVNQDGLSASLLTSEGQPHDVEHFLHNSKNITEEVDLSSRSGDKLDWLVGAFYLGSRLTVGYDQYAAYVGDATPDLLYQSTPTPEIIAAINSGLLYYQDRGAEDRESVSGYGQATYHVTEGLRLTAGLRYTHDHNSTNFANYYVLPPISVAETNTKVTYRLAADRDLTPANLIYGSVSTGFKPGGGNIAAAPAVLTYQFAPETITAYELGSKNSFLGRKLNVNASAFYYQDKNMQLQEEDLINYQGGVGNIPKVDIYGIEGEIAALLPYNLRIDGNATYEKGRVTSHFSALDDVSGLAANQTFINTYGLPAFYNVVYTGSPELNALRGAAYHDVYGNAPPNLPAETAAVNLTHTLPLGERSSLLSRVGVQYRSDYADTIFGKTPVYTAPAYVLTNLFVNYNYETWDLSLAVNNVFDRAAVLSRFTNNYGGETTQLYFPPREFVVSFRYRF